MKRTAPILLLTVAISSSAATDLPTVWVDKDIWPDSPQASTIGRVTAPSPSLLTGACEFSVDLYTLKAEGVELPFQYRYHSNGIRVDDEPCPWGLGWSLTPDIRLTRRIMGRPDGIFSSVAECEPSEMNHARCYHCMTDSNLNIGSVQRQSDFYLDYAPDIFTVHLADRQFSFIYDGKEFVTAGCGEYRIESDSVMRNFTITDPNGYVYNFDVQGEYTETAQALTEWFPSSIKCPSGRKVTFGYIGCTNHRRNSQSKSPPTLHYIKTGTTPQSVPRGYIHASFGGGKHLSWVEFAGERVSLSFSTDNTTHRRSLSGLTVKASDTVIRTFSFTFKDNELLTGISTPTGNFSFTYDPHTFHEGSARDWWGFSNGKKAGNVAGPDVTLTLTPGTTFSFSGGTDRGISANHMQAKILTRVTYPTGGTVGWEYEPHRFDTPYCETGTRYLFSGGQFRHLTEGGGLRVTKITVSNGADDVSPQIFSYIYGENGDGKAVCESVPSIDTFIDYRETLQYAYPSGAYDGGIQTVQSVSVLDESSYLVSHIGMTPVWYSRVEELAPEGKTVYEFGDLCDPEEAVGIDGYFRTYPMTITRAFSDGPQLVRRTVYSGSGTNQAPVLTETREYECDTYGEYHGYSIHRRLNYSGPGVAAPDFSASLRFNLRDGTGYPAIGSDTEVITFSEGSVYTPRRITILPQRALLTGITTVEHMENGDLIRTEAYEYLPGTGLLSRTVSGAPGDSVVTTYSYPLAATSGVLKTMAERNMIGNPTGMTVIHGSARTIENAVMSAVGTLFRPSKIRCRRGSGPDMSTPTYSWNSHGALTRVAYGGSVSESYGWDTGSRHPVTRNDGLNTSEAEWEHGNGISAVISPDGVRTEYTYDGAGRPTGSILVGLGRTKTWTYRVSQSGGSYVQETIHRTSSAGGSNPYTRTVCDFLGRPVTMVSASYGADGHTGWGYTASATAYDCMGRAVRSYPPAPVGGVSVTPSAVATAAASFHSDSSPYARTSWEPSQRGLAVSVMKAGQAWHTKKAEAISRRLTNDRGKHRCVRCRVTAVGGISVSGDYPDGALFVEENTDEDGISTTVYTDFLGNRVMEATGDLRTYYVYDDYGDLRHILPPGLVSASLAPDSEKLRSLGVSKGYDTRGRLSWVRLPGQPETRYLYDSANRVVAETGGNLGSKWRLRFYDRGGREVLVLETSEDVAKIDGLTTACHATASASGTYAGYTLPLALPSGTEVVYACYYDDYSFLDGLTDSSTYMFSRPAGFTDAAVRSPKGRLTGLYTGVGYEAVYYNNLGREIQRRGDGLSAGATSWRYTYAGEVEEERRSFPDALGVPDKSTLLTYDGAGKLTAMTINAGTATATVAYTYDAAGRLMKTTFGGKASQSFTRDIHGWLTEIRTDAFSTVGPQGTVTLPRQLALTERLHYTDGERPRYNGFLSARTIPDGKIQYRYDSYGRLTSAQFPGGTTSTPDFSTAYTYDERGNILTLKRHGVVDRIPYLAGCIDKYGLLDDLTATYDGNFLTKVSGERTDATSFSGKAGASLNGRSASLTWDDAGRLRHDAARGIGTVDYNTVGLPVRIQHMTGLLQEIEYDGLGRRLGISLTEPRTQSVLRRGYYDGGLVTLNDTLEMLLFPGGYFDRNLAPHYYATDYQGNNIAVMDRSGSVERQTWYYPCGEPMRRPVASDIYGSGETSGRYLFAGKEYSDFAGESQYDFGARTLATPTVPYFTQPDPHFLNMPPLSPYSYCGGNPVMNIDPTGMDIVVLNYGYDFTHQHLAMLIQDENGKWRYYSVNGNNVYISGSHTGGREFNDVSVGSWDSPQAFLDSSYNDKNEESKDDKSMNNFGFLEGYQISTTAEQDEIMRNSFSKTAKTEYNLLTNNCATAVQKAMVEAGIPVSEPTMVPSSIPMITPFGIVDVFNGYKMKCEIQIRPSSAFQSIIKFNPSGKLLHKK